VPATLKQIMESEQKDKWLEADRKAIEAILAYPGNRLVSIAVPNEAGLPIARCVTQRKLKIDPATGKFEDRNGYKSRHCVDGAHLTELLRQRGIGNTTDASSAVADDMLIKALLAHAAKEGRGLLKADVPNAYPPAAQQPFLTI